MILFNCASKTDDHISFVSFTWLLCRGTIVNSKLLREILAEKNVLDPTQPVSPFVINVQSCHFLVEGFAASFCKTSEISYFHHFVENDEALFSFQLLKIRFQQKSVNPLKRHN